jgi:S-sulfo-L-cysteine synthase (3-phospho-L-serine-dependent)
MKSERQRRVVLLIESNTTGTGRLFVRAARRIGYHPVLITARPEKYAYLSQRGAPEVVLVSRPAEDEIEAAVRRRFRDGSQIAGITSSSEYFVATAAALAAHFGLPGPDAASVRAARDKSHQREVLAAAGLPTPQFRAVESVADAVEAAGEIGCPVVVKPIDGSGSMGVRVCATAAETRRHAASLLERNPEGRRMRVLVESLVEGSEVSVEVFSGRVVGITTKHLGTPPYFVEVGHDYPARISSDTARALTEIVLRASALLGLQWGPLHWELRIHRGSVYPIEVNPRLAGGFIPELVRRAQGIDLIRQTLRLVVGQLPRLTGRRRRFASIRFLIAPEPGRLRAVEGLTDARRLEGVVDVAMYRSPGDVLNISGDYHDRIGHVMTCADESGIASSSAERARDTVRIRVERSHDEVVTPRDAERWGTASEDVA